VQRCSNDHPYLDIMLLELSFIVSIRVHLQGLPRWRSRLLFVVSGMLIPLSIRWVQRTIAIDRMNVTVK
jgi:hypothetical protein